MLHVYLDSTILTRNDCTQLQQWCKKKRRPPIDHYHELQLVFLKSDLGIPLLV